MDLRSAVEAGWEHQVELLHALVRAPSTLGNERGAQELVAAELPDDRPGAATLGRRDARPGASPPLIAYAGRPNVTAMRPAPAAGAR